MGKHSTLYMYGKTQYPIHVWVKYSTLNIQQVTQSSLHYQNNTARLHVKGIH